MDVSSGGDCDEITTLSETVCTDKAPLSLSITADAPGTSLTVDAVNSGPSGAVYTVSGTVRPGTVSNDFTFDNTGVPHTISTLAAGTQYNISYDVTVSSPCPETLQGHQMECTKHTDPVVTIDDSSATSTSLTIQSIEVPSAVTFSSTVSENSAGISHRNITTPLPFHVEGLLPGNQYTLNVSVTVEGDCPRVFELTMPAKCTKNSDPVVTIITENTTALTITSLTGYDSVEVSYNDSTMDDDFTLAATDVPHTIGALDAGQSYSVVFTVVVSGICAETVTYTESKCTKTLPPNSISVVETSPSPSDKSVDVSVTIPTHSGYSSILVQYSEFGTNDAKIDISINQPDTQSASNEMPKYGAVYEFSAATLNACGENSSHVLDYFITPLPAPTLQPTAFFKNGTAAPFCVWWQADSSDNSYNFVQFTVIQSGSEVVTSGDVPVGHLSVGVHCLDISSASSETDPVLLEFSLKTAVDVMGTPYSEISAPLSAEYNLAEEVYLVNVTTDCEDMSESECEVTIVADEIPIIPQLAFQYQLEQMSTSTVTSGQFDGSDCTLSDDSLIYTCVYTLSGLTAGSTYTISAQLCSFQSCVGENEEWEDEFMLSAAGKRTAFWATVLISAAISKLFQ